MKKWNWLPILCLLFLASCKTPQDITYFQDVDISTVIDTQGDGTIRFQPGDKLSILVHSRDEQMRALFNLGGNADIAQSGGSGNTPCYTVNKDGQIDFPVLGLVKVGGMSRSEVEQYLKNELQVRNLCKDAVVIIRFYHMTFSVLGDAKNAGTKEITKDKTTILEALAMAGDLDILGKRKNVLVMRQEGRQQKPYWIDLTDSRSIYYSPVYYIQQNDVVYVEPNDMHKRNSTAAGSTAYTPSFWMSTASFLSTLAVLIVNVLK